MLSRQDVLQMIKESIDDVNVDATSTTPIPLSSDLVLFGVGSPLDSLNFVNFVAGLEERLEVAQGSPIRLTEIMFDEAAGQPFRSVDALVEYVLALERGESGTE